MSILGTILQAKEQPRCISIVDMFLVLDTKPRVLASKRLPIIAAARPYRYKLRYKLQRAPLSPCLQSAHPVPHIFFTHLSSGSSESFIMSEMITFELLDKQLLF
jgi:hypothetical protein